MTRQLVVFTDLDGTLLDHETYSFDAAREALALLERHAIPLVLATSKTAAEVAPLQKALGIVEPAIVENGAGVCCPSGYFPAPPALPSQIDRREILRRLDRVEPRFRAGFSGFHDWSAEEVSARTGLSLEAAERACDRHWSEPGLWSGTPADLDAFMAAISPIRAVQGGRFLTLTGGATKADAMRALCRAYAERAPDTEIVTVALGDAPNDEEMIGAADFGVIVANPAHPNMPVLAGEKTGHVRRTALAGPAGWNEAIKDIVGTVIAATQRSA